MNRARDIIAKATDGVMISFMTQDDRRALVTYDPVDCVMVVSTRPKYSVMGCRVETFKFLKDGEAEKCKKHIQKLIGWGQIGVEVE